MAGIQQAFGTIFTAAAASSTAFYTGNTSLGSTRNDTAFRVGYQFTMGAASKTITHLGGFISGSPTQTHLVQIYTTGGSSMGSATVDFNGATAGTLVYQSLGSTFVCSASTSYIILIDFAAGGDLWRNESSLTTTAIATIDKSCYVPVPGSPTAFNFGTNSTAFAFPDFKYQ